jgi:hypothetical protein
MAAPVIAYLALDQNNDVIWDPSQSLTNSAAVGQAILTSLRLLQGEWWESLSTGLPAFQQILGQLGSQAGLAAMSLAVQAVVESVPYVAQVNDVSVTFNSDSGLSISATVLTSFSQEVTVSTAPALAAAIGS